jgi:hypothetical protein
LHARRRCGLHRGGAGCPLWAATERPARAVALTLVADGLDAHSNDIVEIADAETFLGQERLQAN